MNINLGKPEETPIVKNCLSCAHRDGRECVLAGTSWRIQRQWNEYHNSPCDKNLSGWVQKAPEPPKPLTFWQRILVYFKNE